LMKQLLLLLEIIKIEVRKHIHLILMYLLILVE
jgi:hypothetical protein